MNWALVLAAISHPIHFDIDQVRAQRAYNLVDVKWEVSLNFGKRAIEGTVTNLLRVLKPNVPLLFDAGELSIKSVTVSGKPARFERSGNALIVQPVESYEAGKSVPVKIVYSGAPRAGLYFIPKEDAFPATTDVIYTQGEMEDNRNWLPTYDFPDNKATSEGTIHVPSGWSVLSNGKLIGKSDDGKTATWHWKMTQPHATYLISFVAGPYSEVPDGPASVPVSTWTPKGLEAWGDATFSGTNKIVELYGKITGTPYPWVKYSQSAVPDFMFGGMENVTCTTQTIGALFPPNLKSHLFNTGLAAHELAHQWTGDLVTTPNWSHIWINEGWASFLPSFFTRESRGQEAYDIERADTLNGGLGAMQGNPNRPMIYKDFKRPIDMFDGFAYAGGAARMHMLMHQLGEPVFWAATKKYFKQYGFKNVDTEQFFNSFSTSSGKDLDAFRQQWFYTSGVPKITVERTDGKTTISGSNGYVFKTEFVTVKDSKRSDEKNVEITKETTSLDSTDLVIVDPGAWLMAQIDYVGYSAKEWIQIFDAATNSGERARLLDKTFNALSLAERISLAKKYRTSELYQRMVSKIADETFQLELSESSDTKLQESAANTLKNLPKSDAIITRLQELIKSDNELVKFAAMSALVKHTNDRAIVDTAWKTDGFREQFRTFALDWYSHNDPDKARLLAVNAILNHSHSPIRMEAMRVIGRIKDKEGSKVGLNALLGVLNERSVNPIRTALDALGEYGDKIAIPYVQPFKDHPLSFVRDNANGALQRLGG